MRTLVLVPYLPVAISIGLAFIGGGIYGFSLRSHPGQRFVPKWSAKLTELIALAGMLFLLGAFGLFMFSMGEYK